MNPGGLLLIILISIAIGAVGQIFWANVFSGRWRPRRFVAAVVGRESDDVALLPFETFREIAEADDWCRRMNVALEQVSGGVPPTVFEVRALERRKRNPRATALTAARRLHQQQAGRGLPRKGDRQGKA